MTKQLTQKELMYLNDYLGAEEKIIKKFNDSSQRIKDAQAKTLLSAVATMHQTHFDTLKKHVDMSAMQ